MDRYKSPSIFEQPYFILEIQLKDCYRKLSELEGECNGLKSELEKYKIRQSELLRQLYNLTKHQQGK